MGSKDPTARNLCRSYHFRNNAYRIWNELSFYPRRCGYIHPQFGVRPPDAGSGIHPFLFRTNRSLTVAARSVLLSRDRKGAVGRLSFPSLADAHGHSWEHPYLEVIPGYAGVRYDPLPAGRTPVSATAGTPWFAGPSRLDCRQMGCILHRKLTWRATKILH